jgi:hypothetical protein
MVEEIRILVHRYGGILVGIEQKTQEGYQSEFLLLYTSRGRISPVCETLLSCHLVFQNASLERFEFVKSTTM